MCLDTGKHKRNIYWHVQTVQHQLWKCKIDIDKFVNDIYRLGYISLALTNNYRCQYYIFWENIYWHLQNIVNCNEIAKKLIIGIDKLVMPITNVDMYFIDVDNFCMEICRLY